MRLTTKQIEAIKQAEHFFGSRADGKQRGFTLVELVMTMVIIGIISAVAIPRFFDTNVFQSRGFADQVKASLRYAQKIAIAQHRFVCVAFTANSVTLTYDTIPPSATHTTITACPGGSALASPSGETSYSISSNNASFSSFPVGGFSFDALGRPNPNALQTLNIVGTTNPITVEAETGYVH